MLDKKISHDQLEHEMQNENLNAESLNLERFIEFSLGHEDFAIPLLIVREVVSIPETTPIPNAPSHFLGMMNLRGQVISVIDLRKKMKIPPKKENLEEAVIIVSLNTLNLGLVVDSINKVLAIAKKDISSLPELEGQFNSEYLLGVYRKKNGLTVLLDLTRILDLKEISKR